MTSELYPRPGSASDPSNRLRSVTEKLFRTRRASVIFVLVVGAMTSLQVLATPVTAMLQGPVEWPFVLPPLAVFLLLVIGCFTQAGTLLLSDRWPFVSVAGTVVAYLALLIGLAVPNWLPGMYLVIALAQFLLAARVSAASAAFSLVGSVTLGMGGLFVWALMFGGDLTAALGFTSNELARFAAPLLGATALGIWWGVQVRRVAAVREQAELARQEHDIHVAEAQEHERARIARELHDVAGQHLAGLVTLADAAIALAPQRPDDALRLVEDVRNEGRFAAASLASALSDLHAGATTPAEATRDLRRSGDLADYWRQRGMRVDLTTTGDVADLPAVVSTTAYRVLQESLTNAAKHAPGSTVDARVILAGGVVEVQICSGPAQPNSTPLRGLDLGWGLNSMRERAELLRGTLSAGPIADGGWEVRVEIPIEPV